mmetsp:Transcript_19299/g.41902  ORF Transcript_19299/g.41902 Transcript_19299/m.41902 type:complete len:250 (-) Transcript_19299:34-783(-)
MISTSNHKGVTLTSGERVALLVLDGDDVERSIVLLKVHKSSNASGIVSLGDHDQSTHLELVDIGHFSSGDVDLDSVVDLDRWVRVTKSASVVGDSNRDLLRCDVHLLDTAKLELGLILLNAVEDETSLGVVKKTEAIAGLLKLNNVHESSGVVEVSSDLSVNLDTTLHADLLALLSGQGVLETLAKDDGNWKALALLVGTGRRLGSPNSGHLAEVPVTGRIEALKVLLGSASHGYLFLLTKGGGSENVG